MRSHIRSECNKLADLLSRHKLKRFRQLSGNKFELNFTPIPSDMWPMEKVYLLERKK